MADPMACGRIRRRAVEIGGSVYLPVVIPQRIEDLFGIVIAMAAEVTDPLEQAFFLMVHLPYLQPFEGVNKRVSWLAANIPFIRHNLCPLSFIDVPQQAYVDAMLGVYELNRIELLRDVFVWAYARSCQQYVAVQQNLVPPDIFWLRHRPAFSEVVAVIVRGDEAASDATVRARTPPACPMPTRRISLPWCWPSSKRCMRAMRFALGLGRWCWRRGGKGMGWTAEASVCGISRPAGARGAG
jgi:hypothetical protein